MWTSYFEYFLTLTLAAVLLRVSYELERPQGMALNPSTVVKGKEGLSALSPQRQEWAKKATQAYAAAQEKKWRRWDQAMFKAK